MNIYELLVAAQRRILREGFGSETRIFAKTPTLKYITTS